MTPGGSFANIMGIQIARSSAFPEIKKKGTKNLPQMKVITSDVSHYSIKKGAILLGIGTDNIILTKTDELGRMNV